MLQRVTTNGILINIHKTHQFREEVTIAINAYSCPIAFITWKKTFNGTMIFSTALEVVYALAMF